MTIEILPKTCLFSYDLHRAIPHPFLVPDSKKQEKDALKVSPYYQDTLSVHPDNVHKKDEATNKISPTSLVKASERPSSTQEIWEEIYNTAQWIWGLVMPHVEIDPSDNSAAKEVINRDSFSLEEKQKCLEEMRQLVQRIKDLNEEEQQDLDYLLTKIYIEQIISKEEQSQESKNSLVEEQKKKREINQERLQKLNEIVTSTQQSKIWGLFEKGASTLGFVAIGVGGISTGWSTLAFLASLGLICDQCLDDPVKKKIAAIISDNSESENVWLERIKVGCGIATLGLFASLGSQSLQTLFSASLSISKGTAVGVKGIIDHQANADNAIVKELANKAVKSDDKIKKELANVKKIISNVYQHYQNLAQIKKNQLEIGLALYR